MAPSSSMDGWFFQSLTVLIALLSAPSIGSPFPQEESAESADSASFGGHVDTYDYIVVGSGPGGAPIASNLAKANYTVLLLEAGDDQSDDVTTQILALTSPKPTNRWDFFVKHYSDEEQTLRHNYLTWKRADGSLWVGPGAAAPEDATLLGVHYPRGATLGGSSVINIAAAFLPSESDWNNVGVLTGDSSWNAANFRSIFERIERNNYLPDPTPGHGFEGYLDTNSNDGTTYQTNVGVTQVLKSMIASIGQDPNDVLEMVQRDANALDPNRDTSQGLYGLPFHVNEIWKRISARDLTLNTLAAGHPLTLKTHALATRILFRQRPSRDPRAVGVEYLEGQSVYTGDPRHDTSNTGTKRRARARKEVIISAGVFNSPQLLKLSGIGPRRELRQFHIPVVSELPGVGENLQDNQELPIVGVGQDFFFPPPDPNDPACTFGAPGDPCVDAFLNGEGPYTRAGPNTHAFMFKSNHSVDGERDFLVFSGPFAFRGFWPAEAEVSLPADPLTVYGMSMVKIHPQNRAGYVHLRSSDPRDTPDINFNLFAQGADTDLGAMSDTVAWGREVYANVGPTWGPIAPTEPPCDPSASSCVETDKQWIKDQAFGHHATGTCAIGKRNDGMAVLDSKFRVRGVKNLRVVDGSAFPRTPGAFPVVATFLISEKASDDVLGALASNEVVDVDVDMPEESGDEI